MSRIAIIADIHANPFALDAVLDDIASVGVDEILVNGDLVGRGPLGSEVVDRIRKKELRSTRGNHEDYLLSFRQREVPEDWLQIPEWSCSRWMAAELSEEDESFLDALPFTLTSEVEPQLRLFHGSPRSYNEGLGHWTPEETLREHLDDIDERVLVVSHTHRPITWSLDDGLIVNTGSVGLPFNGDPRAQYTILEGTGYDFDVELRHVDYDRDAFLESYRTTGFLEAGDATARLLELEVRTARSHLVPFLKWADHLDRRPLLEALDEFLAFYDPTLSMTQLFERLAKMSP